MPLRPSKQPQDCPWIPLDQFIHAALYHPETGYYQRKNPFGSKGDFVTSPEISSLFGEMLGIWCLNKWQEAGSPLPLRLIELGPGRGLLMKDILTLISKISSKLFPHEASDYLLKNTSCHLIEISERLRTIQRETLRDYPQVHWHESMDDIPEGYTVIFANEFFDALPIKQYLLKENGWHERGVIMDTTGAAHPVDHPCPPPNLRFEPTPNKLCEICPLDSLFVHQISHRLRQNGGSALIVDYGDYVEKWQGDTLQALMSHKPVSPFEHIGNADITHHVDFGGLEHLFHQNGLTTNAIVTQGDFLRSQGIDLRANQLGKILSADQKGHFFQAIHRLIAPQEMGALFKVLEV